MSHIKSIINELTSINKEIKRLRNTIKPLNTRKKKLEQDIITYLDEHEQKGVKYKENAFYKSLKIKHTSKSQSQKRSDCVSILSTYGLQNSSVVYEKLLAAMKGEHKEKSILKIQKIK